MIPEHLKKQFILKYHSGGGDKLYRFLISYAVERMADENKSMSPEIELFDLYEKFLSLYRQEDDLTLLEISKICRRAAHKVYRIFMKQNLIDKNVKFLNVVGY